MSEPSPTIADDLDRPINWQRVKRALCWAGMIAGATFLLVFSSATITDWLTARGAVIAAALSSLKLAAGYLWGKLHR